MKNLIVLSWIVGCSLILAEHSHAQGFGKLPTEAYRDEGFSGKNVYTYDNYGHVTSETRYFRREDGEEVWYELRDIQTYEYHQMPSGYFVMSKDQNMEWRRVSTYDNKGMLLYEAEENFEDGVWSVSWGNRAVVNSSGIRTGLERIDVDWGPFTWELDPGYTFDHKGRVVEYYEEYESIDWKKSEQKISQSKHSGNYVTMMAKQMKEQWKKSNRSTGFYKETYEWNTADELVGFSMTLEEDGVTYYFLEYQNLVAVMNGEYFDQYSLYPMDIDMGFYRSEPPLYAWEDYKHLELVFNGNLTIGGLAAGSNAGEYVVTAQINQGGAERIQLISKDGVEVHRSTLTFGNNGSWDIVESGISLMGGPTEWEDLREYNQNGALIRDYTYEEYFWGSYLSENIYDREYNSAGYPTKTSYTYRWESVDEDGVEGDEWGWEETYTAWIDVSITDNATVSNLVVYPNPTSGQFSVFSFQLSDVGAYNIRHIEILDIAGRTVYREPCTVNREPCTVNRKPCTVNRATVEIDISHLPAGIYFVKVGNEMAKLVKK